MQKHYFSFLLFPNLRTRVAWFYSIFGSFLQVFRYFSLSWVNRYNCYLNGKFCLYLTCFCWIFLNFFVASRLWNCQGKYEHEVK